MINVSGQTFAISVLTIVVIIAFASMEANEQYRHAENRLERAAEKTEIARRHFEYRMNQWMDQ